MYEIDFLPVGDGERSGDAIAMRFTRPDTGDVAHVIIDAGFQDDGEALVDHVKRYYGTDHIDLAMLTHPDGDHIGGMGVVVRKLNVGALLVHRIGERGGHPSRPQAPSMTSSKRLRLKAPRSTNLSAELRLLEALTVLGPDPDYYDELVSQQVQEEVAKAVSTARPPGLIARLALRAALKFPIEISFDDGPGANPRNNSSVITLLEVEGFRAPAPRPLFDQDDAGPVWTQVPEPRW